MAWLFKMPLWMKLVSVTSIKIPAATLFQGKTYWGGNTTHENPMTAREQTNGRQSRQKETKGVKKKNYCESINRRKYKEPPLQVIRLPQDCYIFSINHVSCQYAIVADMQPAASLWRSATHRGLVGWRPSGQEDGCSTFCASVRV